MIEFKLPNREVLEAARAELDELRRQKAKTLKPCQPMDGYTLSNTEKQLLVELVLNTRDHKTEPGARYVSSSFLRKRCSGLPLKYTEYLAMWGTRDYRMCNRGTTAAWLPDWSVINPILEQIARDPLFWSRPIPDDLELVSDIDRDRLLDCHLDEETRAGALALACRMNKTGKFKLPFVRNGNGLFYLSVLVMSRKLREYIFNGFWSVDIANCFPTWLVQAADKAGVDCPTWRDYVQNRQEWFADWKSKYGLEPKQTKSVLLRLLFGGKDYTDLPTQAIPLLGDRKLKQLRTERSKAAKAILDQNKRWINKSKYKTEKASGKLYTVCAVTYVKPFQEAMLKLHAPSMLVVDEVILPSSIDTGLLESQLHHHTGFVYSLKQTQL